MLGTLPEVGIVIINPIFESQCFIIIQLIIIIVTIIAMIIEHIYVSTIIFIVGVIVFSSHRWTSLQYIFEFIEFWLSLQLSLL